MKGQSILIIDDNRDVLDALRVLLEDDFDQITLEANVSRLPTLIRTAFNIVLLDMNFSSGLNTGNEGLFWLSKILEQNPETSVIMMTAYGNIDLAVEAIKRGAKDFVLKPWDNLKLLATLKANTLKPKDVKGATAHESIYVIGNSSAMKSLQLQLERVAVTDASVLILGENGTGKELIARELHRLSLRASQKFLTVDLSTLSAGLFESELFGHKKGAFTDARADRKGRFEEANGGTLFLDEIGNLPAAQQVKLLTALQNREVVPVGANNPVSFDVRLISATNAPLLQLAEQGVFRQDLLYRINTITLRVPPLRDRGNDVIDLAQYFLTHFARLYNRSGLTFSQDATQSLLMHQWPGNVRELRHTVEKAVILSSGDMITPADLQLSISSQPVSVLTKTLDELERQALTDALATHGGNIVHAARALGITRQTLYNKMKKYGL